MPKIASFTRAADEARIVVNLAAMTMAEPTGDGTKIHFSDDSVEVAEDLNSVLSAASETSIG